MSQHNDTGSADGVNTATPNTYAQRIIDEVDNLPYHEDAPALYEDALKDYLSFHVAGYVECLGYIRHEIASKIAQQQQYSCWQLDLVNGRFTLAIATEVSRSLVVQKALETLERSRVANVDASLEKKLKSAAPVYSEDEDGELLFRIEHGAARVFGVVKYLLTLIAWTTVAGERRYWVRKATLQQGTPDDKVVNTFLSVPRNVNEKLLTTLIQAVLEHTDDVWWFTQVDTIGTIRYHSLRDGYSQPHIQHIYEAVTKEEHQHEIKAKGFELLSVSEIEEALEAGLFDPDASMAYLDHFIRNGVIRPEAEPNLVLIKSKLRRDF